MTLDYQSATEKFSVLSGEFYNLPAQLPDFSSFLGTWRHCFGLLCHCPLSFLSSPFPVLATLHRVLYKMTENHLLHSFSTSSSCQLFSSDWSWCPEEVWIIYHNRRGVKHSYCPSISLQDEKHGDCWWQSKSSPSPGLLLLQLPSPQLWGSGEGKSFPFLCAFQQAEARGVLLVWGTGFEWVTHCWVGFWVFLWKRLDICFLPWVPLC